MFLNPSDLLGSTILGKTLRTSFHFLFGRREESRIAAIFFVDPDSAYLFNQQFTIGDQADRTGAPSLAQALRKAFTPPERDFHPYGTQQNKNVHDHLRQTSDQNLSLRYSESTVTAGPDMVMIEDHYGDNNRRWSAAEILQMVTVAMENPAMMQSGIDINIPDEDGNPKLIWNDDGTLASDPQNLSDNDIHNILKAQYIAEKQGLRVGNKEILKQVITKFGITETKRKSAIKTIENEYENLLNPLEHADREQRVAAAFYHANQTAVENLEKNDIPAEKRLPTLQEWRKTEALKLQRALDGMSQEELEEQYAETLSVVGTIPVEKIEGEDGDQNFYIRTAHLQRTVKECHAALATMGIHVDERQLVRTTSSESGIDQKEYEDILVFEPEDYARLKRLQLEFKAFIDLAGQSDGQVKRQYHLNNLSEARVVRAAAMNLMLLDYLHREGQGKNHEHRPIPERFTSNQIRLRWTQLVKKRSDIIGIHAEGNTLEGYLNKSGHSQGREASLVGAKQHLLEDLEAIRRQYNDNTDAVKNLNVLINYHWQNTIPHLDTPKKIEQYTYKRTAKKQEQEAPEPDHVVPNHDTEQENGQNTETPPQNGQKHEKKVNIPDDPVEIFRQDPKVVREQLKIGKALTNDNMINIAAALQNLELLDYVYRKSLGQLAEHKAPPERYRVKLARDERLEIKGIGKTLEDYVANGKKLDAGQINSAKERLLGVLRQHQNKLADKNSEAFDALKAAIGHYDCKIDIEPTYEQFPEGPEALKSKKPKKPLVSFGKLPKVTFAGITKTLKEAFTFTNHSKASNIEATYERFMNNSESYGLADENLDAYDKAKNFVINLGVLCDEVDNITNVSEIDSHQKHFKGRREELTNIIKTLPQKAQDDACDLAHHYQSKFNQALRDLDEPSLNLEDPNPEF